MCVCFLPIHSGHQVRWTYQPGCASLSHTHYWYEVGMLKLPHGQFNDYSHTPDTDADTHEDIVLVLKEKPFPQTFAKEIGNFENFQRVFIKQCLLSRRL